MMAAYDPAQAAGRDAAEKVADTALKSVSPANVISKFSTAWIGSNAGAPAAQQAGIAAGALKADYDQNYKDGFVLTGDPAAADKFALEKLGNKYAVSPTNGDRVTAYAPERYYPQVGGSYDWMAEQLDAAVAGKLGVDRTPPSDLGEAIEPASLALKDDSRAERQYGAQRSLVSDDATERDIAAGRPPSYQEIIRDPNGRWSAMTGAGGTAQRFRFDPSAPFAERAAGAEYARPTVLDLQTPQFGGATP